MSTLKRTAPPIERKRSHAIRVESSSPIVELSENCYILIMRLESDPHMNYMSLKEIFTLIYQQNLWQSEETASGKESTLEHTEVLLHILPQVFDLLEVKSILDIPCGDFYWMQYMPLDGIQYHGADLVSELVQKNQATFGSADCHFSELDLTHDDLPEADVLLVRDCFPFLSLLQIHRCLKNISRHSFKYILMTSHSNQLMKSQTGLKNADTTTGTWRWINLELPPFNLPPPLKLLPEVPAEKSLGIWQMQDLAAYRS